MKTNCSASFWMQELDKIQENVVVVLFVDSKEMNKHLNRETCMAESEEQCKARRITSRLCALSDGVILQEDHKILTYGCILNICI